ncbi:MAG: nucleoside phosphorylase [Propionibacteriaceae bacterium]|jgi:uridine phosphorylase|nr:nucleoside phosphorylase [Propionibacteriaceae bacterium]
MITSSFTIDSPPLITPDMTTRPVDDFPETLVVTFQPKTFRTFIQSWRPEPFASIHIEEDTGDQATAYVHTVTQQGVRLGVYCSPAGAPITVATMEQAIALGAKRFVVFGSCGVLDDRLNPEDIIVPTEAYRDEGTSYHYAAASDYIGVSTADRLATELSDMGIPHTLGRVWTTDAFFRETEANLVARRSEGCVAVEMEVAAVAALAQFRGVEAYHFLFSADRLGEHWDPRILGTLPAEPRARLVQIALDLAVRLSS